MLKRIPVFKVRVVYKSGHTEDFETTVFKINGDGYSWEAPGEKRPVMLGADEVAAVWQLGHRFVWRWKK